MSGGRGQARKGKRKLLCYVQRMDRSTVRAFSTHLFVRDTSQPDVVPFTHNEISDRLRRKFPFPVVLMNAQWSACKMRAMETL